VDRFTSRALSWVAIRGALALPVAVPLALACQLGFLASAQIGASDLLFKTLGSQPPRALGGRENGTFPGP
jgi:hypothetical protein